MRNLRLNAASITIQRDSDPSCSRDKSSSIPSSLAGEPEDVSRGADCWVSGEWELGVGGEDVDFPLGDGGILLLVQEYCFREVKFAGYELLLGL